ncbi:zinc finger ccch type domain protein [Ichthyophthirius multifiliis]|uniref:Zinc finger ccch type domain protein n=1 Tax=Ichthyophthirius multifiliis TaxID=5932 RepID=G0R2B0_ICHMU|nr:zinc finger ccch type domain protein [Ichthyophthirius multifiliis]EGR28398.1 zinc finger ccch type domain protein [Ichthyophthirius multifiliis]|eukprot:XP_004027743.1 zinc finger ccch type domain protein [Ichthyophthirius multifiliis]
MYFYKTVWCPNTKDHDRCSCPYMHNVQDFRRDPKKIKLIQEQCSTWIKDNINKYIDGQCETQLDCNYCHGWKEFNYHPLIYKTKQCLNLNYDEDLPIKEINSYVNDFNI